MTAQERPAGRMARPARPAGARINRRTGRPAELERLFALGVSPDVASVLAAGARPAVDDERAYWRRLRQGWPTTAAQRAAHARAQRARRQTAASNPDRTRRSA